MKTKHKNSEIFYTVEGSGNPLVLLHGFLESSAIWKETIEKFSSHRRMIAIDLPGHGQSEILKGEHTMEAFAESVHSILEELGIAKADLLGHSMGGYVALAFMEEFPKMTNRIILLNSTPAADTEERKQNRERSIALAEKNKSAYVSMAISNLLTSENNKKFKDEIQTLKKEAMKIPLEGITKALKGMKSRKNRIQELKSYQGEKIIVAGKQDPILDHNGLKKVAEETNSSFYSLPDGHLSYLENRAGFSEILHFIE